MVGGMLRHMKSLRTMKRDHGFIHTLLEDAPSSHVDLLKLNLAQTGSAWIYTTAALCLTGLQVLCNSTPKILN